jgi:catechol 2,3-dioxygenase-like lactoylglutathione lyase family enzyme
MPVDHIQHILIHSDDIEATAKWFEDNIGLRRGNHPDFKVPLVWLYVGDVHAIHIAPFPEEGETQRFQDRYLGGRKSEARCGSGVIDHVAFGCTGLVDMIDRLDGHKATYLKRQAGDGALFQLFIDGPNGIRVELNFPAAEAIDAGIKPDMTAAEAVAAA